MIPKTVYYSALSLFFVSCKKTEEVKDVVEDKTLVQTAPEEKLDYPPFIAPKGISKGEAIALQVEYNCEAFNNGNADFLVKNTHESNFRDPKNGMDSESFKENVKKGLQSTLNLGMQLESVKATIPTTFYSDGKEEICFVPMTYVLRLNKKRFNVQTFSLAAGSETTGWKFISGAGLAQNPEKLYRLFPDLQKNIVLPPYELTPIESNSK